MKRSLCLFHLSSFLLIFTAAAYCTPSDSPEVLAHRGKVIGGTGTEAPRMTLAKPEGGWTSSMQLEIAGNCSDATADPIEVNINGVRYLIRSSGGSFSRKFPIGPGKNTIVAECRNPAGIGRASTTVEAVISPVPLKFVLTSDTDGVYTDLHIYEPDGTHVYWASTKSPSGGIFYLNSQEGSFDQPGYGPYLFVHPSPPLGVFRIDTNYWPGGAVQHTLANLDIVLNEGLSDQMRRRVRVPLARPNETRTLAYLVLRPNKLPPIVFVPGQDPDSKMPPEVIKYKEEIEPGMQKANPYAFIPPADEGALRRAVSMIALSQGQKISPKWEEKQRDCAGLVRFAYREGIRERSEEQLKDLNAAPKLFLPVVSELSRRVLPYYPKIWETGSDKEGYAVFDDFADAGKLISYNFRPKSRSVAAAREGDLLVYYKSAEADEPYHLMMAASNGAREVVYHNGASGRDSAVRVVSLKELEKAPDVTWIPNEENMHFLGVYEWKRFNPEEKQS